jgi:hypothetical protein
MSAPEIDLDEPTFASAVDASQDQIRDNIIWGLIAVASGTYMLPGWPATPSGGTASEPAVVTMTHASGRNMKFTLTWTSGAVTGVAVQYDKGLGAGYETVTLGTATIAYDGSGNWTGTTWA